MDPMMEVKTTARKMPTMAPDSVMPSWRIIHRLFPDESVSQYMFEAQTIVVVVTMEHEYWSVASQDETVVSEAVEHGDDELASTATEVDVVAAVVAAAVVAAVVAAAVVEVAVVSPVVRLLTALVAVVVVDDASVVVVESAEVTDVSEAALAVSRAARASTEQKRQHSVLGSLEVITPEVKRSGMSFRGRFSAR